MSESALRLVQDLPVCFPERPCVEYPPLTADVINATSALAPQSPAILVGSLAVLGASLVAIGFGLRPRALHRGMSIWLVVVSSLLLLVGVVVVVAKAVDARFSVISSIYGASGDTGTEPPAGLFASWSEVGLAGDAMAFLSAVALVVVAAVAVALQRTSATRQG